MNEIAVTDLKKLGIDLMEDEEIYLVGKINDYLKEGDTVSAFQTVLDTLDDDRESRIAELEDALKDSEEEYAELESAYDELMMGE